MSLARQMLGALKEAGRRILLKARVRGYERIDPKTKRPIRVRAHVRVDPVRTLQFVSPNVRESLQTTDAIAAIESETHRRMREFSALVDRELGISSDPPRDAIGDWATGSENTLLIEARGNVDEDALKLALAFKGKAMRQIATASFQIHKGGSGRAYQMVVEAPSLKGIQQALDQSGIPHRTIQQLKSGGWLITVASHDGSLEGNVARFAQKVGCHAKRLQGTFTLVGDMDFASREVALREYDRIIAECPERFRGSVRRLRRLGRGHLSDVHPDGTGNPKQPVAKAYTTASPSQAVGAAPTTGDQNRLLRLRIRNARAAANTAPSPAKREVGNYRKGHVRLHGLDIAIENPKGSTRTAIDGSWSRRMAHDYGYIKTTRGADDDHVDVFVGDHPASQIVFVVDQVDRDGRFDEHKVILGALTEAEARQIYASAYPAGWRVGPITSLTSEQFREWLAVGDTTKPLAPRVRLVIKARGNPGQRREVQQPGSRGGTFYHTPEGHIVYGKRPIGKRGFRIKKVVDTREYEEGPDERWYPIPESGTERDCDRCGKSHKVHVEVEDIDSGATHVVGSGCAAASGIFSEKQAASVANLAKRARQLEVQIARFKERAAIWDPAWAAATHEAAAMPLPPITGEVHDPERGPVTWRMGDVWAKQQGKVTAEPASERREYLERSWRDRRAREIVARLAPDAKPPQKEALAIAEDLYAKLRARLEKVTTEPHGPSRIAKADSESTPAAQTGQGPTHMATLLVQRFIRKALDRKAKEAAADLAANAAADAAPLPPAVPPEEAAQPKCISVTTTGRIIAEDPPGLFSVDDEGRIKFNRGAQA